MQGRSRSHFKLIEAEARGESTQEEVPQYLEDSVHQPSDRAIVWIPLQNAERVQIKVDPVRPKDRAFVAASRDQQEEAQVYLKLRDKEFWAILRQQREHAPENELEPDCQTEDRHEVIGLEVQPHHKKAAGGEKYLICDFYYTNKLTWWTQPTATTSLW